MKKVPDGEYQQFAQFALSLLNFFFERHEKHQIVIFETKAYPGP
jgi:hypothetical protein